MAQVTAQAFSDAAVGVISTAETSWIEPFSGLAPRTFDRLARGLERTGAAVRRFEVDRRARHR